MARYADHLLDIGAVVVDLHHRLLMTGAQPHIAGVGSVQLADIALYDGIAVDIDRLVKLREHIRDKQAEIGCLGVIIADRQIAVDISQAFADVGKNDADAVCFQNFCLLLRLRRNIGMQDINGIVKIF